MDRAKLNKTSTDLLQKKARQLGLEVPLERTHLIEVLAEYFSKNPGEKTPTSESEEQIDRDLFASTSEAATSWSHPPTAGRSEQYVTAETLRGVVASFTAAMEKQQTRFFTMLQSLQPRTETAPATVPRPGASSPSTGSEDVAGHSSTTRNSHPPHRNGESFPGNSTTWIAAQIPEFGGTEEENIGIWVRRVEKIAQVHGATDGVILLVASSKLVKSARRWYESQDGPVLETWNNLKSELVKMFDHEIPFHRIMQKIEARKWNQGRETFDQYALEKVALLQRYNLPDTDVINLIAGGIMQFSLRATALSIKASSLDVFLDWMRVITNGMGDLSRKPLSSAPPSKNKTNECRNCGKKGHTRMPQRDSTFLLQGERSQVVRLPE